MNGPEAITSPHNPLLRDVRRAVQRASLTSAGLAVAGTLHLLEEALRSSCDIPTVLATPALLPQVQRLLRRHPATRLLSLDEPLLAGLAGTESPQGVVSLVRPPSWTPDQLFSRPPLLLLLDQIQDPGNAGTLLRAAEAFGASGALFLKGSVSPHNPKTLRASAGSLFRLPYLTLPAPEALALIRRHGLELLTAVPRGGTPLHAADLARPCALAIGNEARGISDLLLAASVPLHIPTTGVESLNASLAGAILLYEAARQRRTAP